jgi:hypothetical protein
VVCSGDGAHGGWVLIEHGFVVVGCEWGNGEESCCGFGIER